MGSTVVLIPGLICNELAWADVANLLSDMGVDVVIADVSEPNTITAMAQSVLDSVSSDLIPLGHSMGGRVALEMVRLAPERIKGLGLIATGAHPLAEGETEKREAVIELANEQGMHVLVEKWLPPMVAKGFPEEEPVRYKNLFDSCVSAGEEQHERQIRALVNRPNAMPLLVEINTPTILIAGEEDAWSTPQQHADMESKMVKAETKLVVLNTGHFVQYEAPQLFTETVLGWLKEL
jgi:pimeloyl-ACP methyl ester carboxylesterase